MDHTYVTLAVNQARNVPGPNGPRHPTEFYDFLTGRWRKFNRLTEDEVDFLLDMYFTFVCLMNGVGVEGARRDYLRTIERENELLVARPGRSEISPKMRFRILSRDGFKCRYCGARAPEVRLEIDHAIPVSQGGESTEANMVTACWDCNRGKGAGPIESSED